MRTGRTLTVFRSLLFWGLVHPRRIFGEKNLKKRKKKIPRNPQKWRHLPKIGGPPPKNWGCLVKKNWRLPPCEQNDTHACKNITLAKTSFRPVITPARYEELAIISSKVGLQIGQKLMVARRESSLWLIWPFCSKNLGRLWGPKISAASPHTRARATWWNFPPPYFYRPQQ